jgi:hypothetical protein
MARATTCDHPDPVTEPKQQIRALHTDSTITVYQAYSSTIGLTAARDDRFPAERKRDRMTWIFSVPI